MSATLERNLASVTFRSSTMSRIVRCRVDVRRTQVEERVGARQGLLGAAERKGRVKLCPLQVVPPFVVECSCRFGWNSPARQPIGGSAKLLCKGGR